MHEPVDRSKSLVFDRAADYYDATRSLPPETMAQVIRNLRAELEGRGPSLEIGVGTGRIAVPLAEEGVDVVGVDLSLPMMVKLKEKDRQGLVSVAQADATRLPFRDNSFEAGIASHVFHLIPDWKTALAELLRVIAAGGVLLVAIGTGSGPWEEIYERFREEAGPLAVRPGADRIEEIDEALSSFPNARLLPEVINSDSMTPNELLAMLEKGWYSFTWSMTSEDLVRIADLVRPWAKERYGSLDAPIEDDHAVEWRAYDL